MNSPLWAKIPKVPSNTVDLVDYEHRSTPFLYQLYNQAKILSSPCHGPVSLSKLLFRQTALRLAAPSLGFRPLANCPGFFRQWRKEELGRRTEMSRRYCQHRQQIGQDSCSSRRMCGVRTGLKLSSQELLAFFPDTR